MLMVGGHRQKSILSILLIAVLTTLILFRVVYVHIHILPDGSGISHAHPYSKSSPGNPDTGHQHSNMELLLLDQLDTLMLVGIAVFVLKQFATFNSLQKPVTEHLLSVHVLHSLGRAPPACM